ncbi:hypothetical protein FRC12_011308 [Ceratobasidium sp. 428]|nr:hypothetical protein FRC12_011308 [Ceratobasidium sp. 428]
MLASLKEAFRSLSSIEVQRMSISAFVDELVIALEVSKVEDYEDESEDEAEPEQSDDCLSNDSLNGEDAENDEADGADCLNVDADVLRENMPADQKPDAGLLAQPPTLSSSGASTRSSCP